jgi:hypothetical protein
MRTGHLHRRAEDHQALRQRSALPPFLRILLPLIGAILLSTLAMPTVAFAASVPVDYYPSNAGYGVYSSTVPPASASTHLKVPSLTCTKVKAGLAFGTLVENAKGTVYAAADILEQCANGVADYSAAVNVDSKVTQFDTTVKPGDSIILSSSLSPSRASTTFTDSRTGFTRTLTGSGGTSAYGIIGSAPYATKEVPHFATFSFTDAKVNGAAIGSYTASKGLYELVQTNNGKAPPKGQVEVEPGPLGTSSFAFKWVSAG